MGLARSPPVLEQLAERHTVVRYDGRGIGLSGPYTGEFTEETRQRDLDAVLTAIGAEKAVLLGISEGGWTAATYAVEHPGRVSHLILYGGYCRGAQARPGYDPEEDRALMTLIRKGWGRNTPAFRQVVTSQYFRSDADPALIAHFNELQRLSADPEPPPVISSPHRVRNHDPIRSDCARYPRDASCSRIPSRRRSRARSS
jgi:pimeloyl-ACP methyl ester carboxylesterase